jgi:hypothetical protein
MEKLLALSFLLPSVIFFEVITILQNEKHLASAAKRGFSTFFIEIIIEPITLLIMEFYERSKMEADP